MGKSTRFEMLTGMRRWIAAAACAPLVLLAGCPGDQPVAAKVPVAATAPALAAPAQAAATAAAASAATAQAADVAAKAAKAQQLIKQAESSYSSGVANYRGGRLDAARLDFDYAVDLMLTSGMNLKTDPLLSDEFDHLLNAINSLEMVALKQGTTLSAPLEEAPLDAAEEVTFPENAALTAKVKDELKTTQSDFPLVVNDYVAGFISYFTNSKAGHATLMASLRRAGRYKEMISKVLRDEGVPPGSDLSRGRGVWLSAAGNEPQVRRRRHVAVHADRRLWPGAQRLGR